MRTQEVTRLMLTRPAQIGRWCGFDQLRDDLHGEWLKQMLLGREDMTLLAHRGSYKTTCLTVAIATLMLVEPAKNILFLRKTDEDVTEVIRQVRQLIESDTMQYLSTELYGTPVKLKKATESELTCDCFFSPRGAVQLRGQGISGSLTGKHADVIFTDDIVNLRDRVSLPEREKTIAIYQELQNIRNPGGRILNTGTPWHREDAISRMPNVKRYDCYTTGLLSKEKITELRKAMSPSLFAANYELKHIAAEDALFPEVPSFVADERLLWDGVAHIDAAYGGEDYTALTCGKRGPTGLILYGRLWRRHVEDVLDEILQVCERLKCGPIHLEVNGDKGYLANHLRQKGILCHPYHENMNKYVKISTFLRQEWGNIHFLEGTDPAYLDQILDYTAQSIHDDAPDSAACVARILRRR